jgi:hypothetical protein
MGLSNSRVTGKHIIFSVERDYMTLSDKVHANNKAMSFMDSRGIDYKLAIGCYEGLGETSYIVSYSHYELILALAGKHEQESILILSEATRHGLRPATLYFLQSGDNIDMGYLTGCSKEYALKQNAYTYRPDLNQYWVCNKEIDSKTKCEYTYIN